MSAWPTLLSIVILVATVAPTAVAQPATDAAFPDVDAEERARHLLRDGGHSRPGFDDTTVLTEIPVDLPYRSIVDPARYVPGTVSYGTTSDGGLVGGARLPFETDVHYVLPEHRQRDTHYGTEEIIDVILHAGRVYSDRNPGERIAIGNLSVRDGGDIRWSRSHNSGRDVDIAFPFVDADGAPVAPETLIYVSRTGLARDGSGWQMDFRRAWDIVDGLMSAPSGAVQWVFVYAPLRARILEAGEAAGAAPERLAMAAEVMHQPGDSAPHNDHFHVRLFCSRDDVLEGCTDVGPTRSFAPMYDLDLEVRREELTRGLMDPDGTVAARCAEFLERLNAASRLPRFALALPYQAPEAQLALLDWITREDDRGYTGLIVPIAESGRSDEVRVAAFHALGRLADPDAAPGLAGVIERDATPLADGTPARLAAAHALRNTPDARALPALVGAIADPRPEVRSAVAHVLHRIAGRGSSVDPGAPLAADALAQLSAEWQAWAASVDGLERDAWLAAAFREAGYEVGDLSDAPNLRALARAVGDERDWIAFNADRQLVRHTSWWTPSENWTQSRRAAFWRERVGR